MANPNVPAAPDAPITRKRLITYGALGVALIAALIWGIPTWYYAHTHETTDDAQVDGHIIPVIAKVGGYVDRVAVQDNDSVHTGQLLVSIDSAEYRVKLEQADADLAAARAMAGTRGGQGTGRRGGRERGGTALGRGCADRCRACESQSRRQPISRARKNSSRSRS